MYILGIYNYAYIHAYIHVLIYAHIYIHVYNSWHDPPGALVGLTGKRRRRVANLRQQLSEVEREQDKLEQRGVVVEKQLRQKEVSSNQLLCAYLYPVWPFSSLK